MKRTSISLLLLALGVTGCRELVAPGGGYVLVKDQGSPVRIQTSDLEGGGWIKAFDPITKAWKVVYLNQAGSFTYNEPLPAEAWWCSSTPNDCVAKLQAGDEKGNLALPFYVCTEGYKQRSGRKHCGERTLTKFTINGLDKTKTVELNEALSQGLTEADFPESGTYSWSGDTYSRMVFGDHVLAPFGPNPPDPDSSQSGGGMYFEQPFYADLGTRNPLVDSSQDVVSIDIGATSVFIPWEWKARDEADPLTPILGIKLAPQDANGNPIPNADGTIGRGLAELFLDGIIENTDDRFERSVDALLFIDSLTNIWVREDVSPEFHYRVKEGQPQVCLRQYFTANNQIEAMPDAFYRLDQAILSGFLSIFKFIGYCKTMPVSMRYCGTMSAVGGVGQFALDPESVEVVIDDYRAIKVTCNDQFVPQFQEGMAAGIKDVGAKSLDDGVKALIAGLSETLGVTVRRLEMVPTGIYLVIAWSDTDVQFGAVGTSRPDFQSFDVPLRLRPPVSKEYPARGITRF